jgi:hypothetical protein
MLTDEHEVQPTEGEGYDAPIEIDPAHLEGDYKGGEIIRLKVQGRNSSGMICCTQEKEEAPDADKLADFDSAMAPASSAQTGGGEPQPMQE